MLCLLTPIIRGALRCLHVAGGGFTNSCWHLGPRLAGGNRSVHNSFKFTFYLLIWTCLTTQKTASGYCLVNQSKNSQMHYCCRVLQPRRTLLLISSSFFSDHSKLLNSSVFNRPLFNWKIKLDTGYAYYVGIYIIMWHRLKPEDRLVLTDAGIVQFVNNLSVDRHTENYHWWVNNACMPHIMIISYQIITTCLSNAYFIWMIVMNPYLNKISLNISLTLIAGNLKLLGDNRKLSLDKNSC